MTLTIGVDIGGTKIAAAVVTPSGQVVARREVDTPATHSDAIVAAISTLVVGLRADHDVVAVGLSVAAFIDRTRERVVFAPNLAWRDLPLRALVSDRIGLPVVLENDGNAAAWAEFRHGAAVGVEDSLTVAVGTGVGGGLVMGGVLQRGGHGIAGEIGHLRLVPDGEPCGCGQRGCLEMYASGSALVRRTRERAQAGEGAALLARAGGDVDSIDGPMITDAAHSGDEFALACLAEVGRHLGEGIASLVAVTDPSVVVVGGGVADAGDALLVPLRSALQAHLPGAERQAPPVLAAKLGNDAGFIGAADLARPGG